MKLLQNQNSDNIITIDGPSGSGKSTTGKLLAREKAFVYLDTGAMYRAVALAASRKNLNPEDEDALRELCSEIDISFKQGSDGQKVFLNEEDITEKIRTPEIDMLASGISAVKSVRQALVELQRNAGANGKIVVDGRDAGTVIFPNARFKFFLNATLEERAKRRYKELVEKNLKVVYADIFRDVQRRDRADSSRELSPLRPAADAVIIDTTGMTIEDVLSKISSEIELMASSLT